MFSLKERTAFRVSLLNVSWTQLATESTCKTTALRSSPTIQTIPVKHSKRFTCCPKRYLYL